MKSIEEKKEGEEIEEIKKESEHEIESYINGTILLDDIIASIMYKYDDSEKERLK